MHVFRSRSFQAIIMEYPSLLWLYHSFAVDVPYSAIYNIAWDVCVCVWREKQNPASCFFMVIVYHVSSLWLIGWLVG